MVIKEICNTHVDICADVIRQSFLTVANEFGLTKENCPSNGAFIQSNRLSAERDKGVLQFGLYLQEDIIGFFALEDKGSGVFELEKLAILPGHRHLQYGAHMLDFAKQQVESSNGRKITIGIIEENERLKSWYQKHGFIHTGTKKYAHLPFTVGFMELAI